MFRRITIDGFRGIDDFSMEDFRLVNVMVGRNGSGKTSILYRLKLGQPKRTGTCSAADPYSIEHGFNGCGDE